MANLYKGMAGSPITSLSAAITSTQTSITVDNGAVLPDAPNICTIAGDNAQIETILYTAKSGDVLSSITRGVEGTAKAWSKGTKIARYFTAYDQNGVIAELDKKASKAELADTSIIESGSNANGDYVMFGDGMQICMGKTSVDGEFDGKLKWGSLYYLDAPVMDYPKPFISNPYVIPVSFTALGLLLYTYDSVTVTRTPIIELVRPTTNPKVPITIGYVAIGRWK